MITKEDLIFCLKARNVIYDENCENCKYHDNCNKVFRSVILTKVIKLLENGDKKD